MYCQTIRCKEKSHEANVMKENSRAAVEKFHENKQWFPSTQKYEPLNKFLTCVVGLPGPDRRLLAGTLQFMLPLQSPLDLNR